MSADARHLAAIMFTDMVGYTALAQADEGTALEVLERHNRILRPIFARHRGREVKTVGDAFLVEFDSSLDAVQCAIEVQRTLHEYNLASPDRWKIRIRVGIHLGDVVPSAGDILGDAVNLAARIQTLADPEGISLTQQVYDQVRNKVPTPFERLPAHDLKNVREPVAVYRLVRPWQEPGTGSEPEQGKPRRHLAVLPLANISPDPSDSYFADGLTEELISVLSQVPGLTVIARTSVEPYKTRPKPVSEVGIDLGVGTVLEGSVRKAGNRLRITLQLIDVSTQRHIWANSYNREIDDVFAVQSDVAEQTAAALRLQLTEPGETPPTRQPTADPDAYDWYLRGLAAIATRDGDSADGQYVEEAIRWFSKATERDPSFAEPYASWANVLVGAAGDTRPFRETIPKARELVEKALALDPASSEAHGAHANILFQSDNDWERAEAEFRRAIALNPSNVPAHRFFGLMLFALRRFAESEEVLREALRIDPGGGHRGTIALGQLFGDAPEAAVEYFRELAEEHPDSAAHHTALGFFLAHAGEYEAAEMQADRPLPAKAGESDRYDHALLSAMVGRPAEAQAFFVEHARSPGTDYISGTELAMLRAALGEADAALDLLESEYRAGERVFWLVYQGRWFDPIRASPRFTVLLKAYRLPEDAPRRGRQGTGPQPAASDSR